MQGSVLEIGTAELAMSATEATALFAGAGVAITDADARELVRQTEGWPAGLYLASLAARSGMPAAGLTFTGDDRLMRDYLRSELLAQVSPAQQDFLVRTSILEQLTGPLCDAVLARTGSAGDLEDLESRNLLVVPLDRRGAWYRYHHLLRDLLRSELRNLGPEELRELHLRAAEWYGDHGHADAAIHHAREAGDADRVALLVLQEMQPAWVAGRVETVRAWMDWLSQHPPSRFYTAIAAHGALIFALLGRSGDAERWSAVAEVGPAESVLPDGSTEAATVVYMRAILARGEPARWREDARTALDGLAPLSPYCATMHHTIGLSHLVEGDLAAADAAFAEAWELADAAGAVPLAALVLAERQLVAGTTGDRQAADALLDEAVKAVDSESLDGFWTSALVFATAARSSAEHGHMVAARHFVRRAAHLRPLLTHVLPVVSVQALLELTRAYVELVDPSGARAALQQARGILLRRPGLRGLEEEAQRLSVRLGQVADAAPAGISSLTAAELRLLPLMPTHLSFPQIADQLSLSKHTVKTQVSSLYRKLGVTSRREAVDRVARLDAPGERRRVIRDG
jgi:LuxR family transcriptional regulator, maltose regulon positive regulatory protein